MQHKLEISQMAARLIQPLAISHAYQAAIQQFATSKHASDPEKVSLVAASRTELRRFAATFASSNCNMMMRQGIIHGRGVG